MKTLDNAQDIIDFILSQHQQIKALFDSVLGTRGDARKKAFFEIRRLMAVHETAEEEVIHPAARRLLPNGEGIIQSRLAEEKKAKEVLVALEKLDVDSAAFETKLTALKRDVVAHAESEERDELAALASRLEPEQLTRMRKVVRVAESLAPTRPHPGVESKPANLLVGPFVAMVDRARDALSSR
ncbi:MAG TPA: hemerythrin domain-containing protein [Polyangiaceae bacterium]|nr:hemerythrin domain-containing protein [Polyangiaceae bacterium]